jgi:hypothetical protein
MTASVYSIANVQHALQALKEQIEPHKWADTPLPVIAAPGWWLEEVRKDMGMEAGLEPDTIHDCKVTRMDSIAEPVLVDHDGKTYPILPKWQRAWAAAKEEGST